LLYEAKVVKVYDPETHVVKARLPASQGATEEEFSSEEVPPELLDSLAYFVHYKGWKSTWDEWISEDRVLLWNEENLRTQKDLKNQALAAAATHGKAKKSTLSSSKDDSRKRDGSGRGSDDTPTRGVKRSRGQDDLEKEEDYVRRPEISILVPDQLKSLLVDDWEHVTKEHKLVTLPRKPNVVDILRMYKEATPEKVPGSADADIFDEVLSGIKLYFDRSLGNILLYRFERQQYAELRKEHPERQMSEIYGAEHLLRLFVSLPGLIAQTNMDAPSVSVLKGYLEEFMRFLARNQSELFSGEYEDASPRYEAYVKAV
jgi:mortality factor 4-like protein 1